MEKKKNSLLDEEKNTYNNSQAEKGGIVEIFDSKPKGGMGEDKAAVTSANGYSQDYYSSQNQDNSSAKEVSSASTQF